MTDHMRGHTRGHMGGHSMRNHPAIPRHERSHEGWHERSYEGWHERSHEGTAHERRRAFGRPLHLDGAILRPGEEQAVAAPPHARDRECVARQVRHAAPRQSLHGSEAGACVRHVGGRRWQRCAVGLESEDNRVQLCGAARALLTRGHLAVARGRGEDRGEVADAGGGPPAKGPAADSDLAVLGCGRKPRHRAREVERLPGDGVDPLLVGVHHAERRHVAFLAPLHRLPQRHRAVLAAGHEETAARRPRNAEHPVLVRLEGSARRLGVHVPEADAVIARARRQRVPVGREARREQRLRVARQRRRAARDGAHAEDSLRDVDDADGLLGGGAAQRLLQRRRHLLLRHVERVGHLLLVLQQLVDDELQLHRRGLDRHVELRPRPLTLGGLKLRDQRARRRAAAALGHRAVRRQRGGLDGVAYCGVCPLDAQSRRHVTGEAT
eukprot:4035444-Prymnesium_polylepis.1